MAKNNNNQGFVYDAFDLIRFAWDKKWVLIIISAVAFLASIIISLQIAPRFRSTVTMFPAASVSVSKNLVETNVITSDTKDILTFGEDEEAERLLQVLYSDQVRDHVIGKFNLMEHYKIDTASKFPYTQLMNKYKSNVKFRRTQFLSIEIEVLDQDAQMAADIANGIASYIDSVFYNIKFSRAQEAFFIVEREYTDSKVNIEQLTDSLKTIRSFGINDYESQSEGLNKAYAEAMGAGRMEIVKAIQKQMDVMAKYGGIYVELSDRLEWEIERNSMLKAKLAAAKVNLESTMSNVFIVDKATKAERKALPKRSMIVVISTLSAFALALLLLLIVDNIKVRK
jgi:LPS O-antigen subunit length determinant protein (WzzB/FepE family)